MFPCLLRCRTWISDSKDSRSLRLSLSRRISLTATRWPVSACLARHTTAKDPRPICLSTCQCPIRRGATGAGATAGAEPGSAGASAAGGGSTSIDGAPLGSKEPLGTFPGKFHTLTRRGMRGAGPWTRARGDLATERATRGRPHVLLSHSYKVCLVRVVVKRSGRVGRPLEMDACRIRCWLPGARLAGGSNHTFDEIPEKLEHFATFSRLATRATSRDATAPNSPTDLDVPSTPDRFFAPMLFSVCEPSTPKRDGRWIAQSSKYKSANSVIPRRCSDSSSRDTRVSELVARASRNQATVPCHARWLVIQDRPARREAPRV